jgi:hypothetical protein
MRSSICFGFSNWEDHIYFNYTLSVRDFFSQSCIRLQSDEPDVVELYGTIKVEEKLSVRAWEVGRQFICSSMR